MRFLPTDEQKALAEAIDDVVEGRGGIEVARAWSRAEYGPGLDLWRDLAELGLAGLCIPDDEGGVAGTPSDLVVAFERLGYHGVPGPYLETIALLPDLVTSDVRSGIAGGEVIATASIPGLLPLALDTELSTHAFIVGSDSITPGSAGPTRDSIDPARRLSQLTAAGDGAIVGADKVDIAIDRATLACAAFLLGAGTRMLDEAVAYAKVREQFGRPIGEYQAIKHMLADVHIALTFARPLVHGAALDFDSPLRQRSVSVAKVATGNAANRSARAALQVHGAVGYTAEHDLGLLLTRTKALQGAWGTPTYHRSRIARLLLSPEH